MKETFDDPNWEERWEIHDDAAEGVPTQWFIGPDGGIPDGALGTTSNAVRGAGPSGGDEQAGSYALTLKAGSESWTDYEVSCDMFHMDNDYAGLFVRYVDELNYFRVWTKQEEADQGNNTTFGMDFVVNGTWTHNFKTGGPGVGQDGISGTPIPAGDNIQQRQWFCIGDFDVQIGAVTKKESLMTEPTTVVDCFQASAVPYPRCDADQQKQEGDEQKKIQAQQYARERQLRPP